MSQRAICHFFRKMVTLFSLLIVVAALFAVSNEAPTAHAQARIASHAYTGILPVGATLNGCNNSNISYCDYVVSPNGSYVLFQQGDGNLIERSGNGVIWASHSTNYGLGVSYNAAMQADGNFVIYCHTGACGSALHIYSTCTYHHNGSALYVQNDGNIVVYDSNGKAIWAKTWNYHCS